MMKRKIALFGGTFDPIHLGHTTVAADALELIGAEKIIFVPAKRSPLKGFSPSANDNHRLNMISLAIAGEKKFQVTDFEIKRPAPSYTLETVRKFQTDYGNQTSIHWLIGADTVGDLRFWYKITELIDACNLTTMYRAGCEPPEFTMFEKIWGSRRIEKLQRNIIQTPLVDISSTEIRDLIAKNGDFPKMLHPAVADYIRQNGLYQSKDSTPGA
jgi:nicotinate-nucleotide adenylyltransferase